MTYPNSDQKPDEVTSATPRDDTLIHKARFFDSSLDLLCSINRNGIIQYANQSFESVLGVNPEKIRNVSLCQLIDGDEIVESILNQLDNVVMPVSFQCDFSGIDGSIKWYLWTIYPVETDVYHVIGRDITPYREMEAQELERNIFAEALLDTVLAINASLSLEQVLERILANIGKVVAYDYVNIMLVEGYTAEIVASLSKTPYSIRVNLQDRLRFSIHQEEHLNHMFHERDYMILPDISEPPSWMTASITQLNSGSFLGTTIEAEDAVIGFISIFNTQQDFFTPLHARQITTFANHIGIAILNARLYEQSQLAAILSERQRVAQELHDSVNQDLFAARTYSDLLIKAIENKPELVARYAKDISQLIRGTVEQMRMILIELHPDTLTRMPVSQLIRQLIQSFNKRTNIHVDFSSNTQIILEETQQIAVYRIVQEALHNIEKHASATMVSVSIIKKTDSFILTVSDNGIGFNLDSVTEFQFGIRNMKDRARSINAEIRIDSQHGQGTRITFRKDSSP